MSKVLKTSLFILISFIFLLFIYYINLAVFSKSLLDRSCDLNSNKSILDKDAPCDIQVLNSSDGKSLYIKVLVKSIYNIGENKYINAHLPFLFNTKLSLRFQLGNNQIPFVTCKYSDEPNIITRCMAGVPADISVKTILLVIDPKISDGSCDNINQSFYNIFERKQGFISLFMFKYINKCAPIVSQIYY